MTLPYRCIYVKIKLHPVVDCAELNYNISIVCFIKEFLYCSNNANTVLFAERCREGNCSCY
jgi:hypothetical protein